MSRSSMTVDYGARHVFIVEAANRLTQAEWPKVERPYQPGTEVHTFWLEAFDRMGRYYDRQLIERDKLESIHKLQITSCSVDEWLSLALDAEVTAKDCSVFDPFYQHFCTQRNIFLTAAALREFFS